MTVQVLNKADWAVEYANWISADPATMYVQDMTQNNQ